MSGTHIYQEVKVKLFKREMMGVIREPLDSAVVELKANLDEVARVSEWAELMGYENERRFSRHFFRRFRKRPQYVLTQIRLQSIIGQLRQSKKSNCEIAWQHSMRDEKALYNFVYYHLGMSPTEIQRLPIEEVREILENFGSENWE